MNQPKLLLESISVGDINQWISVRGNPEKPLCLFLHGGPGVSDMPLLHVYCKNLENNFLIVHWDQRGAGKTYNSNTPKSSMNLNQFISDGTSIIKYLLKRFNKEKIHLIGHSWGSALGMFLVQRNPNQLYSYTGIGQLGNWAKGEYLSYKFALDKAKENNDKRAIKELVKMGQPPHDWKKMIRQRQLLAKFGGAVYGKKNFNWLVPSYLFSKEYSLKEKIKFPLAISFSLKHLWSQFTKINLCKEIPQVDIPICFMLGRYDYQVPFECSVEYYETLRAPKKRIIWFEKSGHNPMFEEPVKFMEEFRMNLKEYAS